MPNYVPQPPARFAFSGAVWLPLLLMLTLFAGGCGTRTAEVTDPLRNAPPTASVPDDDGIALTSAELAALRSTGMLDQGLSEAALRDVTVQYKYFLHKGRKTMERFAQRSENYLGHARKVFRDKGMPEELAFLAIVESGYNPQAVSPAGAAGAWQFMPYTGMKYGLNQDWWMDERRDPYKAAEAAADYLKKLHNDFGEWHLAIAAYNAGEGKIGRALERTRTKTFFSLKEKNHMLDEKAQLREETKQYVPRFLAVCKIMRNLEQLGFQRCDYTNAPSVVRLQVRPGTDLLAMSRAAGMSWEEFSSYNGAHKRYVSSAERSTAVYLPAAREKVALAYLNNPRSDGRTGWNSYTASKGDTWQRISQRSGVPAEALQASNKGVRSLRPGMVVLLPGGSGLKSLTSEPQSTAVAAADRRATGKTGAARRAAEPRMKAYTLKSGDTLHELARDNGTSVQALLEANNLSNPNQLRAGQTLRIPAGDVSAAVATAKAPQKGKIVATVAAVESRQGSSGSLGKSSPASKVKKATYTVQPGDTLWGIARKHNMQAKDIMEWNSAAAKGTLRPGDTLVLAE